MRGLLVAVVLAIIPITGAVADDRYLEYMEESGEIIACSDAAVFDQAMLSTWSIKDFSALCHPVLASDFADPKFGGWMFLDEPAWADGTEMFVASRRYSGIVSDTPVYVIWPFPFELQDYSLFIEEAPPPPIATVPDFEVRNAVYVRQVPN